LELLDRDPVLKLKGEKGSMVQGDIDANNFDEDDPIGIFLGGEYDITPQAKAGVGLRLMSETSFSFMANFAF